MEALARLESLMGEDSDGGSQEEGPEGESERVGEEAALSEADEPVAEEA